MSWSGDIDRSTRASGTPIGEGKVAGAFSILLITGAIGAGGYYGGVPAYHALERLDKKDEHSQAGDLPTCKKGQELEPTSDSQLNSAIGQTALCRLDSNVFRITTGNK